MTEQDIQRRIQKYLSTLPDCWCVKVISCNRNGTPDILCCYQGRMVGAEVKHPKGRVSPLQEVQLQRIRDAGGVAGVVRSVGDMQALLAEIETQPASNLAFG